MGLLGMGRKPQIRRFNYTPLYYRPEEDPEEIQRKRLKAAFGDGEAPPTTKEEMLRYRIRERWGHDGNSEELQRMRRRVFSLLLVLAVVIVAMFAL